MRWGLIENAIAKTYPVDISRATRQVATGACYFFPRIDMLYIFLVVEGIPFSSTYFSKSL